MKVNSEIFDAFPVLKSKRLLLRQIKFSDAGKIFQMRANGRINQFIGRSDMQHPDESVRLIENVNEAYRARSGIAWAGILTDDETIIGTCGFNHIDYSNLRAELGGELSIEYWGKNIAQEAVTCIVNFGLNKMNLH